VTYDQDSADEIRRCQPVRVLAVERQRTYR